MFRGLGSRVGELHTGLEEFGLLNMQQEGFATKVCRQGPCGYIVAMQRLDESPLGTEDGLSNLRTGTSLDRQKCETLVLLH